MPATAERYEGLCAPCGTGGRVDPIPRDHEVKPGRRLDWMCILLVLNKEKEGFADYFFETDVWDKDPRFMSRSMKVGTNRGLLRLNKESGQIELLQPMPEDDREQIFSRAARKIKQHWDNDELPEKTMYASG